MSHSESSLRQPPAMTDAELIEDMGTDPEAWAREFLRVGPETAKLTEAWFHHAIEAGRAAGSARPQIEDVPTTPERSPREWGASGFEMRTCAVTARMVLARLREFIAHADEDTAALIRVDWMLGSMIEDRVFRDGVDDAAAMVAAGAHDAS